MIKTKVYYVHLYSLGETDSVLSPGLMVMTARKVYSPEEQYCVLMTEVWDTSSKLCTLPSFLPVSPSAILNSKSLARLTLGPHQIGGCRLIELLS